LLGFSRVFECVLQRVFMVFSWCFPMCFAVGRVSAEGRRFPQMIGRLSPQRTPTLSHASCPRAGTRRGRLHSRSPSTKEMGAERCSFREWKDIGQEGPRGGEPLVLFGFSISDAFILSRSLVEGVRHCPAVARWSQNFVHPASAESWVSGPEMASPPGFIGFFGLCCIHTVEEFSGGGPTPDVGPPKKKKYFPGGGRVYPQRSQMTQRQQQRRNQQRQSRCRDEAGLASVTKGAKEHEEEIRRLRAQVHSRLCGTSRGSGSSGHFGRQALDLVLETAHVFQRAFGQNRELLRLVREKVTPQR
jgi:hypothetical protein